MRQLRMRLRSRSREIGVGRDRPIPSPIPHLVLRPPCVVERCRLVQVVVRRRLRDEHRLLRVLHVVLHVHCRRRDRVRVHLPNPPELVLRVRVGLDVLGVLLPGRTRTDGGQGRGGDAVGTDGAG